MLVPVLGPVSGTAGVRTGTGGLVSVPGRGGVDVTLAKLKLPLLLQVASDPNHIKHDESKDLLELYLGEDYGTDWNSWGQHLTNWIQQNPD